MRAPLLQPIESSYNAATGRWMVVIFDNPTNTVDQVVDILMTATGCDEQEASIETWEAHTYGKASVHFDARDACERVAEIISSIGVRTKVTPEWID